MKLLVRADASPQIGIGHVMRCLALAHACKEQGGEVTFLSHCESEAMQTRIRDAGVALISLDMPYPHPADLQITQEVMASLTNAHKKNIWLVLDGYHFDPAYQQVIRQAGHKVMAIDDMAHLPQYHVDVLLNQNVYADRLDYSCDPDTKQLLGTRYALLRPEFLKWRGWNRETPGVVGKLLVTLGGSDPNNSTLCVIQALQLLNAPDLEVRIVVGPAYPHMETLRKSTEQSKCAIELLTAVTDMPSLMAWADAAISAGGSTCWELAFMGVPFCIITLAENQTKVASVLHEQGCAISLGWSAAINPVDIARTIGDFLHDRTRRLEMVSIGSKLVDGNGARNVISGLIGSQAR